MDDTTYKTHAKIIFYLKIVYHILNLITWVSHNLEIMRDNNIYIYYVNICCIYLSSLHSNYISLNMLYLFMAII